MSKPFTVVVSLMCYFLLASLPSLYYVPILQFVLISPLNKLLAPESQGQFLENQTKRLNHFWKHFIQLLLLASIPTGLIRKTSNMLFSTDPVSLPTFPGLKILPMDPFTYINCKEDGWYRLVRQTCPS